MPRSSRRFLFGAATCQASVLAAAFILAWLAKSPAATAVEPRGGRSDAPAEAQPRQPKPREEQDGFLRITRDAARKPMALETAIATYVESPESAAAAGRTEPLTVDLIGAVHLGSRQYYNTLNRLFADYDAVLYELVAPDNARVPKPGRKPSGAIGNAQHGLTKMLGLEFQLDQIDYTAKNFVHADLSPKEFDAAMAKRGESWW
jgi:hypothetical protein